MSESTEDQKPWYRKAPVIISLVALVFSIASGLYAMSIGHKERIRSKKQEFRELISKMTDVLSHPSVTGNFQQLESMQPAANVDAMTGPAIQFLVYHEAARKLEQEISEHVTYSEYLVLAAFAFGMSGTQSAEAYARKAIERLDNEPDDERKCMAYLLLGDMYFANYPVVSPETARKHYEEAQRIMHGIANDSKSPMVEAEIYVAHALAEYAIGEDKYADALVEKAKQICTLKDQQRKIWESELEDRIDDAKGIVRPV